jgi:hypothetical protein
MTNLTSGMCGGKGILGGLGLNLLGELGLEDILDLVWKSSDDFLILHAKV